MQSLPPFTHIDLTSKFGQLEFTSEHGNPERGRTVFEGLLNSFPKRIDLWSVLIDCEIKAGDRETVRGLFERVTTGGKLKSKQAKFFFKKWLAFEEDVGDEKMVEQVKRKAGEYVRFQKEKET
jgi:rRNA biogenesis protein RRP5